MAINKFKFIPLIIVLFTSCNYKLFVHKGDILYNKTGFAIIKDDYNVYFIECRDSTLSIEKILAKAETSCIGLQDIGAQRLYALQATSKIIDINIEDYFIKEILYKDTIYVSFVRIKGKPKPVYNNDHVYNKSSCIFYQEDKYCFNYYLFNYDLYYIYPESDTINKVFYQKLQEYGRIH